MCVALHRSAAYFRDDIYEIDLSSSNTNDSSMYAISNKRARLNLDSTLLWHCRLGHINKKHIKKLQHDGLFDSTDIKSFENVFPACLERWQENRLFQKEVENQLGKTIKLLDSDRRGKYMSHEFSDHLKEHGIIAHRTPPYTPQHNVVSETIARQEASESLEDLEIIQEEDTHPSLDTSLHHEENDQEIDEPQSDINPIRRSKRTRRATDRLCLHVDAKEHELGDLGEPANYKATLLDPESNKGLNAMNVEMQSMRDNEV
ncbi:zinc finger, CCHC-type containing protein [Tanacetum coccineum]